MRRKQLLIPVLLCNAFLLLCACSTSNFEEQGEDMEVQMRVSLSNWDKITSRASGEMLYPINVLFVPGNVDDVLKKVTIVTGTQFDVSLPAGDYDVYAVCGLPTSLVPLKISSDISVNEASDDSPVDFAVGSKSLSVKTHETPDPISITAKRQMVRLALTVTDVPTAITSMSLFVKEVPETYSLDGEWSKQNVSKYTRIALKRSATEPNTFECDCLLPPSYDKTLYFESMTANSEVSMKAYTLEELWKAGEFRTQNIIFELMETVDGEVLINDWSAVTESGLMSGDDHFVIGSEYYSYPATVVFKNNDQLHVFPYKPMFVKLSDVRTWTDYSDINYMLPGLKVTRYAFPTSRAVPQHLINTLQGNNNCSLSTLNARIASFGYPEISPDATNILAYYDKTADKFYRFDFSNMDQPMVEVNGNDTREFLVYPAGVIKLYK